MGAVQSFSIPRPEPFDTCPLAGVCRVLPVNTSPVELSVSPRTASPPPFTSVVPPTMLLPVNVLPLCMTGAVPVAALLIETPPPSSSHDEPQPSTWLPEKTLPVIVTGIGEAVENTSNPPPLELVALPVNVELVTVS